jgi:flagellar basal-body rod protein FlgF
MRTNEPFVVANFGLSWSIRCCLADRHGSPVARPVLGPFRMNVSLYQAAAALDGNARWQQTISENLASASTPGFKKKDVAFSTVQAGVLGVPTDPFSAKASVLPSATFSTDFARGQLRRTGGKSDLAVEGPGFFAVRLPNGSTAYTRDGEFRVSLQGQLLNKENMEILGAGGPLQLDPRRQEAISVSPQGDISQGAATLGRLQVVEFTPEALKELQAIGGGYFLLNNPDLQPAPAQNTSVVQGFLESSNTLPTSEMSSLLLALRHFEANQRVIQMQDERMGKTIQELSATQ